MAVDDLTRATAALVAVVSLAMIGITISLLPRCFDKFRQRFVALPTFAKKAIVPTLIFAHMPIAWAIAFAWLSEKLPARTQSLMLYVVIGTMLLWLLVDRGVAIKRRIKKQTVAKIGTSGGGAYSTALTYMVLSVWFNIIALIGVSPSMLLIDVGPIGPENYAWGKWCLYIAIYLFSVGIIIFGGTLALERSSHRNDRD
jgi:hypothetical protein